MQVSCSPRSTWNPEFSRPDVGGGRLRRFDSRMRDNFLRLVGAAETASRRASEVEVKEARWLEISLILTPRHEDEVSLKMCQ